MTAIAIADHAFRPTLIDNSNGQPDKLDCVAAGRQLKNEDHLCLSREDCQTIMGVFGFDDVDKFAAFVMEQQRKQSLNEPNQQIFDVPGNTGLNEQTNARRSAGSVVM